MLAGLTLVAVGLTVSGSGSGPAADLLGDALYAALVWVVLAFVAVRWSAPVVTAVAIAVCAVVELAQLTGVPAAVTAAWAPARYLLGTTFAALDVVAYAVGAVAAGAFARRSAVGAVAARAFARRSAVGAVAARAFAPRPATGASAARPVVALLARPTRPTAVPPERAGTPEGGGRRTDIPLPVDPHRGGSQGKA